MKYVPFEITGLDFAGSLYVKDGVGQKQKVYILLFTCAVIRTVHLEMTFGLSAEDIVRGLRRFVARRGFPKKIYSDNACSFRRTAQEIKEVARNSETESVKAFSSKCSIEWKFIAERAPWWGSWWERLIQTVKNGLKFALGKTLVSFDELRTVLLEVESCVNLRPLTYISDDVSDLLTLTPAHFLINLADSGLETGIETTTTHLDIVKLWKNRVTLTKKFWRK